MALPWVFVAVLALGWIVTLALLLVQTARLRDRPTRWESRPVPFEPTGKATVTYRHVGELPPVKDDIHWHPGGFE